MAIKRLAETPSTTGAPPRRIVVRSRIHGGSPARQHLFYATACALFAEIPSSDTPSHSRRAVCGRCLRCFAIACRRTAPFSAGAAYRQTAFMAYLLFCRALRLLMFTNIPVDHWFNAEPSATHRQHLDRTRCCGQCSSVSLSLSAAFIRCGRRSMRCFSTPDAYCPETWVWGDALANSGLSLYCVSTLSRHSFEG